MIYEIPWDYCETQNLPIHCNDDDDDDDYADDDDDYFNVNDDNDDEWCWCRGLHNLRESISQISLLRNQLV